MLCLYIFNFTLQPFCIKQLVWSRIVRMSTPGSVLRYRCWFEVWLNPELYSSPAHPSFRKTSFLALVLEMCYCSPAVKGLWM